MRAYLDTCLISAIAKSDLKEAEQVALDSLYRRYVANETELFASEHVEEELNKIPEQYRQRHIDIYEMFSLVPKLRVGGITRMGPMGGPIANPKKRIMNSLLELLPDQDDAMHIFIASQNRLKYFITADVSTIIKHKERIENICGISALLPSEYLLKFSD